MADGFAKGHERFPIPARGAAVVLAVAALLASVTGFGVAHAGRAPDRATGALGIARSALGTISNSGHWRPLGPAPVMYNGRAYTGRVTALAVSPSNSNVVWLGAADGGVWESTDGGAHWTPKFDSAPIQAVGAIAIDPSHANTIYVGTGEANNNADALWGEGVFKSTDGGSTWTRYGMSSFGTGAVARIAVDPFNSADV